jgi:uncharacterized membrane protein
MTDDSSITQEDRLYGALCLATVGVVGVLALSQEAQRARPFIRYHAVHSIALGIPVILVSLTGLGLCLTLPAWLALLFLALRTYQGATLTVPVLTDFLKNRGWV